MENLLFVPYDPFNYDHLEQFITNEVDTVFGHFDVVDFGGHNVVPTKLFSKHGIGLVVNGHDHLARVEWRDDVEIVVTGSMQPYTHAEDRTGELYVTATLEELQNLDVKNKNVRVLLKDGEALPEDLDCLSLTAKRVAVDETVTVDTTEFESLDVKDMLALTLDGLSVKTEILSRFAE